MLPIRPFQSSHCFRRDSGEKSNLAVVRDTQECESGVIRVSSLSSLKSPHWRFFLNFDQKRLEILFYFLVLTSLQRRIDSGKIHLQTIKKRAMSLSCCCCKGWDCQLQPAV